MKDSALEKPLLGSNGFRIFNKSISVQRRLIYAIIFCLIFTIIELVVGLMSHSLALISDASHLISDLCSYFISLFGLHLSKKKATKTMSFGFNRAEILGALLSILLIWIMTIMLVYEAIQRMITPVEVDGFSMFITAIFGTLSNLFISLVLSVHHHGIGSIGDNCGNHNHSSSFVTNICSEQLEDGNESEDEPKKNILKNYPYLSHSPIIRKLNSDSKENHDIHLHDHTHSHKHSHKHSHEQDSLALRSAYIHVLGDILQNIGVMIAGLCIWFNPTWTIADPLCTVLFSFFVLGTTFRILKDSTNVLMEGTPLGIDCVSIQNDFLKLCSVLEVHDLHVWSLSVGVPALSCHIVVSSEESARITLRYATALCQKKYGIYHTTIQIDYSSNKITCGTIHHQKCLIGSNGVSENRGTNLGHSV